MTTKKDQYKVHTAKAQASTTTKRKRRHKPKDFPKRPLSAYNIFFKETRERILASNKDDEGEEKEKLAFQFMAKEIASRWKNLSDGDRVRVEGLAKVDMVRYREAVRVYEEEMVKKSRQQREEAATLQEQESSNPPGLLEQTYNTGVAPVTSISSAGMSGATHHDEAHDELRGEEYEQLGQGQLAQYAALYHRELLQRQLLEESWAGMSVAAHHDNAHDKLHSEEHELLVQGQLAQYAALRHREMLQMQIEELRAIDARESQIRQLQYRLPAGNALASILHAQQLGLSHPSLHANQEALLAGLGLGGTSFGGGGSYCLPQAGAYPELALQGYYAQQFSGQDYLSRAP
jgi:single-stranded DNA-binding protein